MYSFIQLFGIIIILHIFLHKKVLEFYFALMFLKIKTYISMCWNGVQGS